MAIVLTVVADGPAALAELWGHLGGNKAEVDIVGDEMFIAVDLTTPEPGRVPDDPYGELTPEQEAQVEEVLSHPIHPEGPWEDAVEAPEPDHDGHTVDVGQVVAVEPLTDEEAPEPDPAAEVVPIDQKSREHHPASGTLAAKVLELLQGSPDEDFTPSDIFDEIEGSTYGGVQSTIAGLVRTGHAQRNGRGKYRAAAQ